MPLLTVKNLSVFFPIRRGIFARTVGFVKAVENVSLTIDPGETLALVGESGSGKSTLARAILGLLPPSAGTIMTGHGPVNGRCDPLTIQVVFQDPLASLNPRLTVRELLTEAPLVHHLIAKADARAYAAKWLAEVGLGPEILDRYPHAFSGGQRQRICIARALALNPKLLICDEAVSALDLSVRAQVLNLLEELKAKFHLAYLFITHDMSVVEHIADRIAVMFRGHIVEQGDALEILAHPQNPYTQQLLAAVPRIQAATH